MYNCMYTGWECRVKLHTITVTICYIRFTYIHLLFVTDHFLPSGKARRIKKVKEKGTRSYLMYNTAGREVITAKK